MKKNYLYQVSTLNALMMGDYNGSVTVEEFLKHADTGIGTFDGLDGEAIFYQGVAYDGRATGLVNKMDGKDLVPFGCGTKFDESVAAHEISFDSIAEFKKNIDSALVSKNYFYILKIEGKFDVKVRSCFKQEKPYEPLYKVACDQREFEYKDVEGVVIGLYCPNYVEGINLPGWHIHFLSKDLNHGGHILEVATRGAKYKINKLDEWNLILPNSEEFKMWNLKEDLKEKTEAVEGNTKK